LARTSKEHIKKLKAEIGRPARIFTAAGQPATTMSPPSNEAGHRWDALSGRVADG